MSSGVILSIRLLSDYLDQHALAPLAIKFAVENLFSRPEIQFAVGSGDES
jgi:hypothetical protein